MNDGMSVTFLPMDDAEALEYELKKGDVSSLIIEGVQGIGGIRVPGEGFLRDIRRLCTQYEVCLILDEIQSGYGRTGKFFAHQYSGIRPDLITVAKGMGNGFPISGVLIHPMFKAKTGSLGTTFGGNHLACAAAISVLEIMEKENLIGNAEKVGRRIMDGLRDLPHLKEVRGYGLMIGIEMDAPVGDIRRSLLYRQRTFTGVAGSNIIRLLPPLSLTVTEAEEGIDNIMEAAKGA
jgi:acetylornithine aminotransferase